MKMIIYALILLTCFLGLFILLFMKKREKFTENVKGINKLNRIKKYNENISEIFVKNDFYELNKNTFFELNNNDDFFKLSEKTENKTEKRIQTRLQ